MPATSTSGSQPQGVLMQPTAVIQGGQQIIQGPILVNPGGASSAGQFIQAPAGGGGTFYMTPQGLVQAAPLTPMSQSQQQPHIATSSPQQLLVPISSPSVSQISPMQQQPPVLQRQQSLSSSNSPTKSGRCNDGDYVQ